MLDQVDFMVNIIKLWVFCKFSFCFLLENVALIINLSWLLSNGGKRLKRSTSEESIFDEQILKISNNENTVENMWLNGQIIKAVDLEKFNKQKQANNSIVLDFNIDDTTFKLLQKCAILSSDTIFYPHKKFEPLEKSVIRDNLEIALIKFFNAIEDVQVIRNKNKIHKSKNLDSKLAFDPFNKLSLSIVYDEQSDSELSIFIKGAPEIIWSICTTIYSQGKNIEIDENWKNLFEEANKTFCDLGQQVLAFAKLSLSAANFENDYQLKFSSSGKLPNLPESNFPMTGYTFLGLLSFSETFE